MDSNNEFDRIAKLLKEHKLFRNKDLAKVLSLSEQQVKNKRNGSQKFTQHELSKLNSLLAKSQANIPEYTKTANATPFGSSERIIPKLEGNVIYVPHAAYAGFCGGNNNPLTNEDLEVWTLPFLKYLAFCFEVSGNSMYRTLRDGEKVFVEQQSLRDIRDLQQNKIHVVELSGGDYLIKRVSLTDKNDAIRIMSDNPEHFDRQEIFSLEHDVKRIWKVKDALKWDLGFMEDMEGLDTSIEEAALKLDKT